MCIENNEYVLLEEKSKKTLLVLWKVICVDNTIGIWQGTYSDRNFVAGLNVAEDYDNRNMVKRGRFHCFFTKKIARLYQKQHVHQQRKFKIIKMYANRQDIMDVGYDEACGLFAVSVSKMEIRSLKHQR